MVSVPVPTHTNEDRVSKMTFGLPSRILGAVNSSSSPPSPSSDTNSFDADFVVILAALLCALICMIGLVAVARCAWIRRISDRSSAPPANTPLKKKVLQSFPKLTYSSDLSEKFSDCAICLAEFIAGDEMRVLPQCGHGFHVGCIDTWLGSHSSCPSCRQIVQVCQKCGELPETEDQMINRFLP